MRRCPHLPVLCTVYNLSDIIVARVNYLNYFMEWFSQECIPQKKHLYFYERHDENGWIPGGGANFRVQVSNDPQAKKLKRDPVL